MFKYFKKKHGQDTLIVTCTSEDLKTSLMETEADIHFIKTYKPENIIPAFAKVKLQIKNSIRKLPDLLWKQNCKPNIKLERRSKDK